VTSRTAEPSNDHATLVRVFVAASISASLGIGAGVLMAYIAPGDKFSWAGLAVAPLWLAWRALRWQPLCCLVFTRLGSWCGPYERAAA